MSRGVDLDHGDVEVGVGSGHPAGGLAAVSERDGRLGVPQVVGIGEEAARRDDDAGADAPSAPQPDDGGAGAIGRGLDGGLKVFEQCHELISIVTCKLQVATVPPMVNAPTIQAVTDDTSSQDAPDAARSALADALAAVGDRWTLLVVAALLDGPRRFGEIQDDVGGIAPSVLTQRLRALERQVLVVARPYSERPPRFIYELSAAGRELAGVLRLLAGWGARNAEGASAPRHDVCGTPMEARWWCPTCEQTVADDAGEELHYA